MTARLNEQIGAGVGDRSRLMTQRTRNGEDVVLKQGPAPPLQPPFCREEFREEAGRSDPWRSWGKRVRAGSSRRCTPTSHQRALLRGNAKSCMSFFLRLPWALFRLRKYTNDIPTYPDRGTSSRVLAGPKKVASSPGKRTSLSTSGVDHCLRQGSHREEHKLSARAPAAKEGHVAR